MSLISLNNLSIAFGGPNLLDAATLQVEVGEQASQISYNYGTLYSLVGNFLSIFNLSIFYFYR